MVLKNYLKKIKNKGVRGTIDWCFSKITGKQSIKNNKSPAHVYHILLLTNRDSDNTGDQVIEACAKSLISTVMINLNLTNYKIHSRAASMISQKYLDTRDPQFIQSAEKSIKESDLIIYGGAPVFNWHHQVFYEFTATTIELAHRYGKPIIFSSIGIEGYNGHDERCQRLKNALKLDCVKQITTRDDFASLKKFAENSSAFIAKVSDSAVLSNKVFEKHYVIPSDRNKIKIGIFIFRAGGFNANGIPFSREEAANLWKSLINELEKKGYDYELLTSGHFADEAFMDYLIRKHDVPASKCQFNINTPETLVSKIAEYSAIISCRLHPSIIAFSMQVPSLGIIWNDKVKHFYENIGYSDRVFQVREIKAENLITKVEESIKQGVNIDTEYIMSVYHTLFNGVKSVFKADEAITPYTYDELMEKMPPFNGTSRTEELKKLKRKFRRAYDGYNNALAREENLKKQLGL